ncbi:MAG: ligase, partial [Burkholderiaceae bacterium]
ALGCAAADAQALAATTVSAAELAACFDGQACAQRLEWALQSALEQEICPPVS